MKKKPGAAALGADLVIPLLALAFAGYFFVSITDLVWEAKANGVIIGTLLVILVVAQGVRVAVAYVHGRGTFSFAPLWEPRDVLGKRVALLAVAIAFVATLQWLGLTLGLFAGMLAALLLMGVRRPAVLLGISAAVSVSAYLLFIAALDSNFPHGPVEDAVAALRGTGE